MSSTLPTRTPLPKLQISILLYLQLAEPIAATVIYPFVNQAVRRIGITGGDDKKTGYFAGLIESSFYLTEAFCVLQWGRASDRIGRRPVLIGGLLGLTSSMIGFGLSKRYWSMLLSRCAAGLLNGNIGVTKSVMGEITDASNMAQGFAFTCVVWYVGGTIGPIMGGVLSDPTLHWPKLFRSSFWIRYPYFLPCLATACYSISAVVLASICLKETLPAALARPKRSKDNKKCQIADHEAGELATLSTRVEKSLDRVVGSEIDTFNVEEVSTTRANALEESLHRDRCLPRLNTEEHGSPPTTAKLRALLIPRIIYPMINYGFLAFIDQCFAVIQPLMYSTSIADGGLGLSTLSIGIILGVWGFVNVFLQVFAFARIHEQVGTRRLFMCGIACYVFCFSAFPLMSALARRDGRVSVAVWAVLISQLVVFYVCSVCYSCIFIFITDGAPNKAELGATNGLAQTMASTMRAIAPSAASSLFSVSVERDLAGGTLVYWVMCAIVIAGVCAARWLPARLRSQSEI